MAIIVEDGTGLATAESFVSVAYADAYHVARGNTAWDALDAADDKEPALRRAMDFMGNMYRMRWKGNRATITQALDWPRAFVEKPDVLSMGYGYPAYYLFTEIPTEVKQAQCELALRAAAGELAADLSADDYAKSVKVGPIEIQYKDYIPVIKIFRAIEGKLSPLFVGNSSSARLVRT